MREKSRCVFLHMPIARKGKHQVMAAIVKADASISNNSFVVCLCQFTAKADASLGGVNLVKESAIGKVGFGGLLPTAKGFFDFEELDLGQLLGVLGLGFG